MGKSCDGCRQDPFRWEGKWVTWVNWVEQLALGKRLVVRGSHMLMQATALRGLPSGRVVNQRNIRRLDKSLDLLTTDWWKDRKKTDPGVLKAAYRTACLVKVKIRSRVFDLGWVARNKPTELERLMDSTSPDHRDYWAIVLVYNRYEKRIAQACEHRSALIQKETVRSLAAR